MYKRNLHVMLVGRKSKMGHEKRKGFRKRIGIVMMEAQCKFA